MLIEEKVLKHWIDNFYGYGSWDAKFWFVAYEEGGGEHPEEVAEKINYFSKTNRGGADELCDIRDLYSHVGMRLEGSRANLFANRFEYRFGKKAVQDTVWKNLIAFIHGYKNKKLPDPLAYQQNNFATPSGNEALMQFYPLPSPHNHAWYYSWLDAPNLSFIKTRAQYQEQVYPVRIEKFLLQIQANKPQVVLMYGMDNINALKQSVQEYFEGVKFKMVKGIKLETPQHHRADFNGTTLLITTQVPALRHNRIETGFDWEEFGKRVKAATV
jgi:hypothetical protein